MLHLTVNSTPYEVPSGLTLLQALRRVGVEVPSACADDRLHACGACRLCLVRINGESRAVAACSSRVVEGMCVGTHPADIEKDRRTLLGMLARDLPREALERHPDLPFYRLLKQYGMESAMLGNPLRVPQDESHPYIRVDLNQCIACFRCVRICTLAQGKSVWRVRGRGEATRVIPDSGGALAESTCVGCGACADTCPTGALMDKSVLRHGEPTARTRSTCAYCGVGCEIEVGTRDGRVVQILPAPDAPVNKGLLCVKGRYAFDYVHAADRVTAPLIREDGLWREVSWDEALAFTAENLRRIVAEHGADSVGVLGSARATNEDNYLTQKFARVVLGTNNVDCCARVCHAPSAAALKAMLGTGAATNSYDDIERAKTLLVCGANATESHPIVGKRILRAALHHGAKLIVVDPRRTELAAHATIHLALRPGTNVPLFNAMAHVIVEEGLADPDALRERVDALEDFKTFIADYSPEKVAEVCGVDAGLIRDVARLYATAKPSMCLHGLGMTEHLQGTEGVMALTNLALLTGNFGKPGTGMNPLRGQNNVQGSAHMGCEPASLTGGVPIEAGRARFESVCGVPPPSRKGLTMVQMMDAAGAGKLKALWSIGYDISFSNPDSELTARNLAALDFVIVQDLFMNEIARRHATVFLPAVSSFEKDGTFMNAERRIQRVRKAIEPLGQAKADWEIVALLARAMGRGEFFSYPDAESVWNEIRRIWPAGAGMSYPRLESCGIQWPCPSEEHPGTTILHETEFTLGPRAALRRIAYAPTPERSDAEYPFLLTTGRCLYQFNAGTMSMRTPNAVLRPTDTLDVCPSDAARLGVGDGERVRLCSRYGATELPVRVTDTVKPGELFATFHDTAVYLNRVTGHVRDNITGAPEYKVTAVRVEKLGE